MFHSIFVISIAALNLNAVADPPAGLEIRGANGKALIAAKQILSYEWVTHTITLPPKLQRELWDQLKNQLVSGVAFEVVAAGQVVYKGTFTTNVSSRSFATPVIVLEPADSSDRIKIKLAYPTPAFFKGEDPRADPRVRDALKASGVLLIQDHNEWIAASLKQMLTIKPGMTREELFKVFREEGGIASRTQRRFAFRDSPHVKVDVTFKPADPAEARKSESMTDVITHISKPYLEWPILD